MVSKCPSCKTCMQLQVNGVNQDKGNMPHIQPPETATWTRTILQQDLCAFHKSRYDDHMIVTHFCGTVFLILAVRNRLA